MSRRVQGKIMIIMIIMISAFFQNLMEKTQGGGRKGRGGCRVLRRVRVPSTPEVVVSRGVRGENYDNYDICLFSESHGNFAVRG